jgi:hypothetical protein
VTIARVSAALVARGSVRIMTLAAVPIAEFVAHFSAAVEPAAEDRSPEPLEQAATDPA